MGCKTGWAQTPPLFHRRRRPHAGNPIETTFPDAVGVVSADTVVALRRGLLAICANVFLGFVCASGLAYTINGAIDAQRPPSYTLTLLISLCVSNLTGLAASVLSLAVLFDARLYAKIVRGTDSWLARIYCGVAAYHLIGAAAATSAFLYAYECCGAGFTPTMWHLFRLTAVDLVLYMGVVVGVVEPSFRRGL